MEEKHHPMAPPSLDFGVRRNAHNSHASEDRPGPLFIQAPYIHPAVWGGPSRRPPEATSCRTSLRSPRHVAGRVAPIMILLIIEAQTQQ